MTFSVILYYLGELNKNSPLRPDFLGKRVMVPHSNRKYLDPTVLSKLANLELVARCAVEGYYSGLHPSPFHGFSVEYSDHRAYQPGDELKFLDWKAFGRSDKLYIKQFQQETNVTVYILLDSSQSMSFTSIPSVNKLDYGSFLAAILAYLMFGQGDSVSLVLFADRITHQIPAQSRRSHLRNILIALQQNKASGRTNVAGVLHAVAEVTHRRGLVIVISDFLDERANLYQGLAHLKYLGHDVILFHTLDHQELNLEYQGLVQFEDLESRWSLRTFPQSIQASYRQQVAEFVSELSRTAGQNDIDYCLLDTTVSLDKALTAYLMKRRQLL